MVRRGVSPQRTCLGCGARGEQKDLIRFTLTGQGFLKVEQQGNGRGGYLHRAQECWEAFIRRKSLYRAFHVEINKGAKVKLIEDLKERNWE